MRKLYTRTGDDGTTGLFGGPRVKKDDPRVAAYGDVDELNAQIGLAVAVIRRDGSEMLRVRLERIQNQLFNLGAELATPDASKQGMVPHVEPRHSQQLEQWIDEASAAVAPLTTFVLPGGSVAAAHLHVCRTVCRRAERSVITLSGNVKISPEIVIYLNRLSDLLFAWARQANRMVGVSDVPWVKEGS